MENKEIKKFPLICIHGEIIDGVLTSEDGKRYKLFNIGGETSGLDGYFLLEKRRGNWWLRRHVDEPKS